MSVGAAPAKDDSAKIDQIYQLLVGIPGVPESGFVERTTNSLKVHAARIRALEKWRLALGGSTGLLIVGNLARLFTEILKNKGH